MNKSGFAVPQILIFTLALAVVVGGYLVFKPEVKNQEQEYYVSPEGKKYPSPEEPTPTGAQTNDISSDVIVPVGKITVLSPNGGEKWKIGETYNITWDSSYYDRREKIDISLLKQKMDEGIEIANVYIVKGVDNTGSYKWTVPVSFPFSADRLVDIVDGNYYKVFVGLADSGESNKSNESDASDNFFYLVK